jgi:adenine-specific DNA-methyltransferase
VAEGVFGNENFVGLIPFVTTSLQTAEDIGSIADYLLWFAKDRDQLKYRQLYLPKDPRATGGWGFNYVEEETGIRRSLTTDERRNPAAIVDRMYRLDNLTSQGPTPTGTVEFTFNKKTYHPGARNHWKTSISGMETLARVGRIQESSGQIQYVRFFDDFGVQPLTNLWTDTTQAGFVDAKLYAVQAVTKVIERSLLMTTDPGDLVLDPTCGSGTTAYVAEQWGRRWITIDTSRVPLALARQRLLTATFPYYELKDEARGPAGGFVYKRK